MRNASFFTQNPRYQRTGRGDARHRVDIFALWTKQIRYALRARYAHLAVCRYALQARRDICSPCTQGSRYNKSRAFNPHHQRTRYSVLHSEELPQGRNRRISSFRLRWMSSPAMFWIDTGAGSFLHTSSLQSLRVSHSGFCIPFRFAQDRLIARQCVARSPTRTFSEIFRTHPRRALHCQTPRSFCAHVAHPSHRLRRVSVEKQGAVMRIRHQFLQY